ncbi:MAG: asparagine--tRNA ligase [Bacilli bacterium]|jgi:asparaginyl-tRNA synthetase|nr:asparagine--tRNA ligase [Bacilli bacterium]
MDKTNYLTVREIYEGVVGKTIQDDSPVEIDGWVINNRFMGKMGFISFNDGTCFKNAQLVYSDDNKDFAALEALRLGASISIKGNVKLTPEAKQPFEIHLASFFLYGDVDDSYPLQKKKTSFDYLRTIPHLRPRTNTFRAVFRVRSVLSMAIHEFFQGEGFIYVHTPILTSNDAEGAGATFQVASDISHPEEYFGKKVTLTVSGQLHVEPFCMAYRDVYTFGPTFRAEKSTTTHHAAEFWMIEPEIAFADIYDDMDLIQDFLKYIVKYVMANCPDEIDFFDQFVEKGLKKRLQDFVDKPFTQVSYTDAIELLLKAKKDGHVFKNDNIFWGLDLESEHERYLTEEIFKGPIFLTDYPKEIKSFYMKQNPDGKTVAAVDLLVPEIGELVGGSEREADYDKLLKRMQELKMNIPTYQWYLDLRRYGTCPHAGFGLGFERMMQFVTGMANIRDVEAYPRTFKECDF